MSDEEPRIYPCDECGVMRTKSEGGMVFTVCDACWDRRYQLQRQDRDARMSEPLKERAHAPPECKLCSRPGRSIAVEIDGKVIGAVDLCDGCEKEVQHHLTLVARN